MPFSFSTCQSCITPVKGNSVYANLIQRTFFTFPQGQRLRRTRQPLQCLSSRSNERCKVNESTEHCPAITITHHLPFFLLSDTHCQPAGESRSAQTCHRQGCHACHANLKSERRGADSLTASAWKGRLNSKLGSLMEMEQRSKN